MKGTMIDITHNNLHNGPKVISRRTFIKVTGIALAGSAFLAVAGHGLRTLWVRQVLPGSLQRSMLSQHLGDTFHIQLDSSNVVAVQLSHVRDLGASQNAKTTSVDMEHSFSILFRGPGDRLLGQGTYQFGHYQIGSFPLFIVPMAPDRDARYYEAVFNRLPA
jgi:hypothetical protein